MQQPLFRFFSFLAIVLLWSGCRLPEPNPNWDADVLFPIGKGTFDFQDILQSDRIQEDSDSSLNLVVEDRIFRLAIDSLFEFPDTTISDIFTIPVNGIQFGPGQVLIQDTQETKYNLNDVELTKAVLRSGTVSVKLVSQMDEAVVFSYKLPLTTLNGAPLFISETVPANSSIIRTVDLAGYTLDLTGSNGNQVNTVVSELFAQVDPAGNVVTINSGDFALIENNIIDIVPEYVEGFFGQDIYEIGPDSDSTDILKNIKSGTIDLNDITFNLGIRNYVGAEIEAEFLSIGSGNSVSGATAQLVSGQLNGTKRINRAVNVAFDGHPSTPTLFELGLNSGNSNLDEVFEVIPDYFTYNLNLELNPLGNVSGSKDFIYYNEGLEIYLSAVAPLQLAASNLVLADTIDWNPGERPIDTPLDQLNFGFVRAHVSNQFPLGGMMQLYLMDNNNTVLDSLVGVNSSFDGANLLPNNHTTVAAESILEFPVSQDKIDAVYAATRAKIVFKLNTANYPQIVNIYSDYSISVTLVGDINYHFDTE